MSRSHLALLALLFASQVVMADNRPIERSTNDRLIIDALAKLHDRGATLFNAGDYPGCYRLFQGSLSTIKLVLPPDLQEEIDRGLAQADSEMDPVRRALVLHDLIENVRKKLHPTAGKVEVLPKAKSNADSLDFPKSAPEKPNRDKASPDKSLDINRPAPVHLGGDPKFSDEPPLAPPTGPMLGTPSVPPLPHPQNPMIPEPKTPIGLPDTPPLDPTPSPIPAVPTSNPKKTKPITPFEEPPPESLSTPPRPVISTPPPSISPSNPPKALPAPAPSSEPSFVPLPAGPIATNAPTKPATPKSSNGSPIKNGPAPSSGPSFLSIPKSAGLSNDPPLVPLPMDPTPSTVPAIPAPAAPSGGLPELTAPPPSASSTETKPATATAPPLLPPPGK